MIKFILFLMIMTLIVSATTLKHRVDKLDAMFPKTPKTIEVKGGWNV